MSKDKKVEKVEVEFDVHAEEKKLRERYPDQQIVKGSLKPAGEVAEFGNKRTVEIKCQRTHKPFRIATSDLHQVKFCKEAIAAIRLERRSEARKANAKPKKEKAPKAEKKPRKAKAEKAPTEKRRGGRRKAAEVSDAQASETPPQIGGNVIETAPDGAVPDHQEQLAGETVAAE
jgi:hypothetical protein